MNDEKMLDWAEFVATKFSANHTGWVYSRDLKGLEHIRYRSDYTGYNHWTKRLTRALQKWNPVRYFWPKSSLDKMFAVRKRKKSLKGFFIRAWVGSVVALRKDKNLPDGQINGIITHWEEDGEYIALFQPRVGMKVLDFVRSDPTNPYAQAIVTEMRACKELSWPSKGAEDGY